MTKNTAPWSPLILTRSGVVWIGYWVPWALLSMIVAIRNMVSDIPRIFHSRFFISSKEEEMYNHEKSIEIWFIDISLYLLVLPCQKPMYGKYLITFKNRKWQPIYGDQITSSKTTSFVPSLIRSLSTRFIFCCSFCFFHLVLSIICSVSLYLDFSSSLHLNLSVT